jgi:hypothetical protein
LLPDATEIFLWHISRSWDDKGDVVVYSYANEDSAGITRVPAHEANRTPATRAAQTYLTTIQYGNTTPYFPNWGAASEVALPSNWVFRSGFEVRTYRRVTFDALR